MNHLAARSYVCFLMPVVLLGCHGDGLVSVSGTAQWQGQPIEKGMINFYPTDPSQRPHGGPIEDGAFSFRASPGEKLVEVFADRPVGEPDPVMNLQRYEQFIPTRYNEATELTATVTSSGGTFEFLLVEEEGDKRAGSDVSRRPR